MSGFDCQQNSSAASPCPAPAVPTCPPSPSRTIVSSHNPSFGLTSPTPLGSALIVSPSNPVTVPAEIHNINESVDDISLVSVDIIHAESENSLTNVDDDPCSNSTQHLLPAQPGSHNSLHNLN